MTALARQTVPARPTIVVTAADLAQEAVALLADFDLVYAGKTPDEETLVRICTERQPVALIVRYSTISARIMDTSANLAVISKHGAGIDTIDLEAAKARNIAVRAASGANAAAVAEHAFALILACAKGIVTMDARLRAGFWDKATHKSFELAGKTLGLIGFGAIGRRVAELGRAASMQVIVHDPFVASAPDGVTLVSLHEVLASSHVVSLHCPLTPENRNFINRDAISRMRDGAILVNTARGGLINDDALIEALSSGKLRAAGLDSFQVEPLVGEHRFKNVPNVVLSPHIGGVTADAYVAMGVGAARNILDVLAARALSLPARGG
jgi:D-3-phosphoglycerate dehydrogenase / 2-oxoglutarate reductase